MIKYCVLIFPPGGKNNIKLIPHTDLLLAINLPPALRFCSYGVNRLSPAAILGFTLVGVQVLKETGCELGVGLRRKDLANTGSSNPRK